MKRKLVKQGAATMMVSLPAKWIKSNNLEKGDELDIVEKGKELIVSIESQKIKSEVEINLSSLTETSIRTLITNVYRDGYDRIKINFKDKPALPIIRDVVEHYIIGFEIINKTENHCILENITEPSKDQFDNILSKMLINIDDLFIIAESWLNGKKEDFLEVEQKIKQFDNFCRRIISKHGFDDKANLQLAFHVELIHAQREIYHMLRYMDKNKIKTGSAEMDALVECKKLFDVLKQAYLKKDISLLEKIHDLEKDIIYKKGYNSIKKSHPIVMHHLLSSARGFYLASSPLVGLFL